MRQFWGIIVIQTTFLRSGGPIHMKTIPISRLHVTPQKGEREVNLILSPKLGLMEHDSNLYRFYVGLSSNDANFQNSIVDSRFFAHFGSVCYNF